MSATIIDGAARFKRAAESRRFKTALKHFEDTLLCYRNGVGSFTSVDVWTAFEGLIAEYHSQKVQS